MGKQTVGKSSCEGSNSSSRGPYGYSQSSYFGDYFSFCSETLAAECKTLGQVNVALKRAGLESPNLLLGIDFTQSNEWTGRMANEEYKVNGSSSQNEGCPNSSAERATSRKNKKKKQSQESVKTEHEQEIHEHSPPAGGNLQAGDMRVESGKNKIKKKLLEEASLSKEGSKKCNGERKKKVKETKRQLLQKTAEDEEEDVNTVGFSQEVNPAAEGGKIETAKGKEEEEVIGINPIEEEDPKSNVEMVNRLKKKKNKEQLLKEAAKADKRGVCYLSRIPPHMDHVKLRHILSQYGEIQRIYLAPEDPTARVNRKRAGGFRGQEFSEGWVEFTSKSIAKRVANMLNGEQIGGRKRSQFYYDLWNIKYLSKFKWDDLTEEIAHKSAIREQKLALEISAAKRERDFYLNKVDQSRALSSIEERLKKKQKVQQESGGQLSVGEQAPMVIRQFPQTKPVADKVEESKSQLSKDILAEVFGGL